MTAAPELGTPRTASPDLLRSVFRQHAAGVAVITAAGERPVGFTATSLNSVAAEPPSSPSASVRRPPAGP